MSAQSTLCPVIIVEDSDEDFDTVVEAVRNADTVADMQRATTGGGCLDLLRGATAVRPAVVLMDLNTPGTGDDALKLYPVLVFSTSADPRDLAFSYAAGANAYHVKPVRYPDHLQLVIDLLTCWLGRVTLPYPAGTKP